MDRLSVISSFESIDTDSNLVSLFSAMVTCLDPSQACSFFDISFEQEAKKRSIIMKKICRDIKIEYYDFHRELIYSLMKSMDSLPSNKRQSCGYCLSHIAEFIPEKDKKDIISFFLLSQWKQLRNRGYKYLLSNWNDSWASCIEENWRKWSDFEAARLLIEFFPGSYLLNNFDTFLPVFEDTYFLRKLFLKVIPFDLEKLKQLREKDSITYTYILVKLNLKIDDNEAIIIFNENQADKRIGLLIWCFGQMGLWAVLLNIYKQIGEIKQARYQVVFNEDKKLEFMKEAKIQIENGDLDEVREDC